IKGYDHIESARGIQWPYASGSANAAIGHERRLFSDGQFYTADGRAVFHFDAPRPMPEPPDYDYPFLLLTGRGSSSQWHTGSRTDKSEVLRRLAPTALYVEINPKDAMGLNLENNDTVTVRSRRGTAVAFVVITPNIQSGQLFMPMHFAHVNRLTHPSFDPHSRQPCYQACAVRIDRAPTGLDEADSSF
ncbi:MAG TPA: molybdopterin oxidoreductase family protein, partial [Opitutaceae bacterium]|nr:molybdopterin oxidoreductase family protein [Opitutaceae bacterium]